MIDGLAGEARLFRRPAVLAAVFALIVVPSLYVLIYVSSVWDPYGNLGRLPAAIVNDDTPFAAGNTSRKLGADLTETLRKERPFAFQVYPTAASAREAVEQGRVFFALLIPNDFTRQALTGVGPEETASFTVYLSPGSNYTASLLSQRFGLELAHRLNERVNEERWKALVAPANDAGSTLRGGLAQLQDGAIRLGQGTHLLRTGTQDFNLQFARATSGAQRVQVGTLALAEAGERLARGYGQVAAGLDTILAKLPNGDQMTKLAEGSAALRRGADELRAGTSELSRGLPRIVSGAGELETGARRVPLFGGRLGAGATQLKAGVERFQAGFDRAASGIERLDQGITQMDTAVQPLSAGVVRLTSGLREMREKLPAAESLDRFTRGFAQLSDGTSELNSGMAQLAAGAARIEAGSGELDEGALRLNAGLNLVHSEFENAFGQLTPEKLARPVELRVETYAPVKNNGSAFAPYFCALSLWIGAVMMSFVFYLRRLPASLQVRPRIIRWYVKVLPLYGLGLLQASVVTFVVVVVLRIQVTSPWQFWGAALIGSAAFVSTVGALLAILGDAGRLLAVILLIFQLAASGGIYPVELSPAFYSTLHPWLPFTHLVEAFRATMFGATNGTWSTPALCLILCAVLATLLGITLARWRYIRDNEYGPAVDF